MGGTTEMVTVVKQVMLASYFTGHLYFLKECPDTLLKFSGFKLHHRQERQEYHRIPAVLKQHVLDDTMGSQIFPGFLHKPQTSS